MPQIGLIVPIKGVADEAPNQCAEMPCSLDKAHETITFTIRTGKPGRYRWQCFVPCAAGFIDGFARADADDRLHGRLPPRDLRHHGCPSPATSAAC